MNENFDRLIGSQIVSMSDKEIVVKNGVEKYVLSIVCDDGDCCGYNEISASLYYNEKSKDNPIITKVVREDSISERDFATCKVTFYGDSKIVGELHTLSSSGSGWCYGACVTIVCKELNINDCLSSW